MHSANIVMSFRAGLKSFGLNILDRFSIYGTSDPTDSSLKNFDYSLKGEDTLPII